MVAYTNIYYIIVFAWIIHFFYSSVTSLVNGDEMLPWATCGNWWNTDGCISITGNNGTGDFTRGYDDTGDFVLGSNDTGDFILGNNGTVNNSSVDSAMEYWE